MKTSFLFLVGVVTAVCGLASCDYGYPYGFATTGHGYAPTAFRTSYPGVPYYRSSYASPDLPYYGHPYYGSSFSSYGTRYFGTSYYGIRRYGSRPYYSSALYGRRYYSGIAAPYPTYVARSNYCYPCDGGAYGYR